MNIYTYQMFLEFKKTRDGNVKNTTTAGIFIMNTEGKILICKATGIDEWSIPKGQQDPGEDNLTTAKRETFEETNIDLDSPDIEVIRYVKLNKYPYKKTNKTLVPYLYLVNFKTEPDIKCNSFFPNKKGIETPEMEAYKWVTLKEAVEILHEAQVRCIMDNKNIFKIIRKIQ